MHRISALLFAAVLLSCASIAHAQAPAVRPGEDLSSWKRVQSLPAKTKVHITKDHGSATCRIFAVSEDTLTCASYPGNTAGKMIQRSEVKKIKLAREAVSTAAGAGIGAAGGALIGVASTGNGSILRGLGIGLAALIGALPGALLGGTTDFTRGPTIYVRP